MKTVQLLGEFKIIFSCFSWVKFYIKVSQFKNQIKLVRGSHPLLRTGPSGKGGGSQQPKSSVELAFSMPKAFTHCS